MEVKKIKNFEDQCVFQEILKVIGGKWSMSIIYMLFSGKKRFSELERSIPHINTRMLVKELKNLVENGVIVREVFATVPATVEYSLTEKGEKLESIIDDIYNWGVVYLN
ncbi:MAG: winged helix-turn-helix transcriptional regulator [Sphingobacterium sp.]|uniref:winged helix-turn-helix transcriptional regulator n=1 Tax=Sphingobacterium sp. JB170 TaxID=1434842 RepID=UPI00097F0994|nr:helix-turn-helix domain-containing protein [Sphingobacterium sp. JB170]SJN48499.1 Transcriptional regulator, HxlR family [Sphingobacterium sp. JB170]